MTAVMTGRVLATSEYQWPVATKGLARERANEAIFCFFSGRRRRIGFFFLASKLVSSLSSSLLFSLLLLGTTARAEVQELGPVWKREREKESRGHTVSAKNEKREERRERERGRSAKSRRRFLLFARLLPFMPAKARAFGGSLCQSPS